MDIPAHQRRAIARRSLVVASAVVSGGASVTAGLLALGEVRLGLGVLAGHALAVACGLSWIVGAVATFDGPFRRFARATIGLAPVRLALVVATVCGLARFAGAWVDVAALGLSFVATQLLLQLAQADCFMRLADAASPVKRARRPARFW